MYKDHLKKIQGKLAIFNIDSFFISNFYNILYLSGFKTLTTDEREGFLLITNKKVYLFTDSRYVDDMLFELLKKSQIEFRLIEAGKGLLFHLQDISAKDNLKKIGFESEDLTFLEHDRIQQSLETIELVPTQNIVLTERTIKDNDEIEKIKKACELSDKCLEDIRKMLKKNITEKEIAFKMEMWIKEKGYDLAFDPIVAFDTHSALAHYNTKMGNGILKDGSVILIDFGIKHNDYLSDITRMFFYGKPSNEVENVYDVLKKAQEKTMNSINEDSTPQSVDILCRQLITNNGLPDYNHSLGHGVGLEIHEYPKVSKYSQDTFEHGQIFTVEPGIYLEGKFGMRIEDTVVMKTGTIESLTHYSKEINII